MPSPQLLVILILICLLSFIYGVPQEICMFDVQCQNFCQRHGYSKGFCQTRWPTHVSAKIQRNCYCHECDPLKCMSYCYKMKLQFTGCMCDNLLVPGGPVFGIYNKHNLNDCSDDKLFCQCGKNDGQSKWFNPNV